MAQSLLEGQLTARIEQECQAGGYSLGWRLLYSPAAVLQGARVAFIGLNPGGAFKPVDHATFAMKQGSAYELEDWGQPPGTSVLQRQVLTLFSILGESSDGVLAGNLVPFRSPSWKELPGRARALQFGKAIWGDILSRARPKWVITMGNVAADAMRELLGVANARKIPVNWGHVSAQCGEGNDGVSFVGLPHLSRYTIMSRIESAPVLRQLFDLAPAR